MKNRNRMVSAGLATLLLASCGSDNSSAGYSGGEVHACEIVPGTVISQIAGAALVESNVDVERTNGNDAFSQCTHTLQGPRNRVTVQVRTQAAPMAMSRQNDADRMRAADDSTGYSVEWADAIEAGSNISGLGDVAYAFEISETVFVVAYKNKHVEVRAWTLIGQEGRERALEISKAAVARALEQL